MLVLFEWVVPECPNQCVWLPVQFMQPMAMPVRGLQFESPVRNFGT